MPLTSQIDNTPSKKAGKKKKKPIKGLYSSTAMANASQILSDARG